MAGVDSEEPKRVAEAVQQMNIRRIVAITMVNRDELRDGGADALRLDDPLDPAAESRLQG